MNIYIKIRMILNYMKKVHCNINMQNLAEL